MGIVLFWVVVAIIILSISLSKLYQRVKFAETAIAKMLWKEIIDKYELNKYGLEIWSEEEEDKILSEVKKEIFRYSEQYGEPTRITTYLLGEEFRYLKEDIYSADLDGWRRSRKDAEAEAEKKEAEENE